MHVEGDPDRHLRSDRVTHATKDLGVGVGKELRHRSAVQREEDAIEPAALIERRQQVVRHVLERVGGDGPHRGQLVEDERHHVDRRIGGAELEVPAEGRLGVGELGDELVTAYRSCGEPTLQRRRHGGVRVRLVIHPECGEAQSGLQQRPADVVDGEVDAARRDAAAVDERWSRVHRG